MAVPAVVLIRRCLQELEEHFVNLQAQTDDLLNEKVALLSRQDFSESECDKALKPDIEQQPLCLPVVPGIPNGTESTVIDDSTSRSKTSKDQPESLGRSRLQQRTHKSEEFDIVKKSKTMAHLRMAMLRDNKEHNNIDGKIDSLFKDIKEELSSLKNIFLTRGKDDALEIRFVQSIGFRIFSAFMIASNTVYIGAEANMRVKNAFRKIAVPPVDADESGIYGVLENTFMVWFLIELLLRVYAEKKEFIFGEDRNWNLFDALLVFFSVIDRLLPDLKGNINQLRIVRVFRLVRVVRVVRTVPWLRSLRTMVFAVLNSFVSLLWAFAFIWLMIFIFGIVFLKGVEDWVLKLPNAQSMTEEDIANADSMQLHFGSLYETMISLLASITGGNDWMQYGELLRMLDQADLYFLIFLFYVAFIIIGLLNVVTGIFVDSAVCTRTEDEVVETFKADQRRTRDEVKRIFKDADSDESGAITLQELETHLEDSWVRAYFSGLDLDPSEAQSMFALMDIDGDGLVNIDEFVDGCLKLKGHAKSIDVLSIMYDNANYFEKFGKLSKALHDDIRHLQRMHGMTTATSNASANGSPTTLSVPLPAHDSDTELESTDGPQFRLGRCVE